MNKPAQLHRAQKRMLVTQPYVPDLNKYMKYVEQAFDRKWLTNGGPLLAELTTRLKELLKVKHLLIVNNGTSALQVAYQVKQLSGKTVLTTPFTFPATSNAMHWQNIRVELADIDEKSWNLCPKATQKMLRSKKIDAIVPVNIFAAPCDLEAFDSIGKEHNIPIIYDSAQAMLSTYQDNNIFSHGDIHCISFHATKLFHCVEGGALTFNNEQDYERAKKLINFGFDQAGYVTEPGINAKMSELHAAMGLCILDELPKLINDRENSIKLYKEELKGYVEFQQTEYPSYIPPMYMPIKLESEQQLEQVKKTLLEQGYESRKYFDPSFNYFDGAESLKKDSVCQRISDRILCLPLMHDLSKEHIVNISNIVKAG